MITIARPPPRVAVAGAVVLLVVLGLLVALHQVTRASVQQAELRREAAAQYWEASWRCSHLRGASRQQECLARLAASQRKGR